MMRNDNYVTKHPTQPFLVEGFKMIEQREHVKIKLKAAEIAEFHCFDL